MPNNDYEPIKPWVRDLFTPKKEDVTLNPEEKIEPVVDLETKVEDLVTPVPGPLDTKVPTSEVPKVEEVKPEPMIKSEPVAPVVEKKVPVPTPVNTKVLPPVVEVPVVDPKLKVLPKEELKP
jgi:hypothetical protein